MFCHILARFKVKPILICKCIYMPINTSDNGFLFENNISSSINNIS